MGTILDTLAECAARRTEAHKKARPLASLRAEAEAMPKGDFPFEEALKKDGISFICECKKASPSKGLIAPDFPYLQIAKEYEQAGADCISVLTEPDYFLGSDKYLAEIATAVQIPCLRKDFTVDPYMIYEAKTLGASAVLLICAILDRDLKDFSVDGSHAQNLRKYGPEDILFVSESGIRNAEDVQAARAAGADAVLVGETLMRAADKAEMLRILKGETA